MNLSVIRDDSDIIRHHIIAYHYLHRYPDPRSLPFAYRLIVDEKSSAPDGRLWGIIVMKKPQHHKQKGLFGYDNLPTSWQVLDLARVWIHPDLQTRRDGHSLCMFSQMVGLVLKRVRWDWLEHHPPRFPSLPYHITLIISYCDLNHHDGAAYRASNFQRGGFTGDGTKEIYYRKMKELTQRWQSTRPMQLPLFEGIPIRHF